MAGKGRRESQARLDKLQERGSRVRKDDCADGPRAVRSSVRLRLEVAGSTSPLPGQRERRVLLGRLGDRGLYRYTLFFFVVLVDYGAGDRGIGWQGIKELGRRDRLLGGIW